ncbi:hypothetical protein HHI36_010595 [Cryptolaemus montrouzieri]|uniref:Uncharacterized protein n=1 Tax=Cryptolaemus montrouzieri TaxID=559131 RepID=A0ABD2MJ97_9CUCU
MVEEIADSIDTKKKKYSTWLRSNQDKHLQEYKAGKNEVRRLIKTEKNNSWDSHCQQIETLIGGKRSSEVWKFILSLKSSNKDDVHISIIKPEEWKDHYANLLHEKRTGYSDESPKKNIRVQGEKVEIGVETTRKVAISIKAGKSSGREGIYIEILKNGKEKLFERLTLVGQPESREDRIVNLINKEKITRKPEIAEVMNTTLINNIKANIKKGDETKLDTIKESLFLLAFYESDVKKSISSLQSNKSPGPDNITSNLVKEIKTEMTQILRDLLNESTAKDIVPDI